MKGPTYAKIWELATKLHKETKAPERRKLGVELHSLLTKSEIRKKLISDCTPEKAGPDDLSIPAIRRQRLSQLWSMAILAAVTSVSNHRSTKGKKAKLQAADVELPQKLLTASEVPDGVFESDNLAIPKLAKKDVNRLLNYCLNMLEDEEALNLSEVKLLDMLRQLCAKEEYVAYFSKSKYTKVFGEIHERLTSECEMENPAIFKTSAQILEALFRSCQKIGRQMDEYVSGALQIIAVWCKNTNRSKISGALVDLYNTVATILFTHPDHSIGPLKRFGRPILSYCKKCYGLSNDRTQKDALHNFILSMLFVSQVAGDYQGLWTGDMGNLGKATMSDQHINEFLVLVLEDAVQSSAYYDESHQRKKKNSGEWISPDLKQQRHLETVARLLSIAQRRFLAKTELLLMGEDANDGLRKYLKVREDNSSNWVDPKAPVAKPCPPDVFAESPFVKHVVARLITSSQTSATAKQNSSSEVSTIWSDSRLEVLKSLQVPNNVSEQVQAGLLAIICACSEMFPAGDCWTSMTGCESWLRVPLSSSDVHRGVLHFHPSSLNDLNLLVVTVADLLEANGGPSGNQTLQGWAMIALIRLSESFGAVHANRNCKIADYDAISATWRRVWKILVRTDLRYHVYTEVSKNNSLGELVLVLLKNMVDMRCTDPQMMLQDEIQAKRRSFMYEHQHQIWALPTFGDFNRCSSVTSLFLMSSMLAVAGLSDAGIDRIDSSLCKVIFPSDDIFPTGRRKRLLSLSLGCLASWVSRESPESNAVDSNSLSPTIAALTTVALVNGTVGNSTNEIIQSLISACLNHLRCVPCTVDQSCSPWTGLRPDLAPPIEAAMQSLWIGHGPDCNPQTKESVHLRLDRSLAIARSIRKQIAELRVTTSNGDFVPEVESNDLRICAMKFFEDRLTPISIEDDSGDLMDSDGKNTEKPLSLQTLGVKLRISLHLSSAQGKLSNSAKLVVTETSNFFSSASMRLSTLKNDLQFSLVATNLLQIAEALLEISPLVSTLTTDSDQIKEVVEQYKAMLIEFFKAHREGTIDDAPPREENGTKGLKANDFLEDDDNDDDNGVDPDRPAPKGSDLSDDDDVNVDTSRKRKRWSIDNRGQRSRKRPHRSREATLAVPQNEESAMKVASLLIALDPSPASCELVCQALLGTELDFDPSDIKGDINLRMAPFCLRLVCTANTMLHTKAKQLLVENNNSMEADQHRSVVQLLSTIVDFVRSCEIPSSPTWGTGAVECAQAVEATNIAGKDFSLSETEIGHLIDILESRECNRSRPWLRAQQIASATYAFRTADAAFHQKYDDIFLNSTKRSLQDPSSAVRRNGHDAIVACFERLDCKRVAGAVMSALPPIAELVGETTVTGEFSTWYKSSESLASGVEQELVTEIEDACEPLESDAIMCHALVAGATQDVRHFQETLFEVLRVSSMRPGQEYACYRALERTAMMRGYDGVEEMIESESTSLLARLVQSGFKRFPLLLTAPNILRQAMVCGIQGSSDVLCHSGQLNDEAEYIFASRLRRVLLPLMLFETVSKDKNIGEHDDAAGILKVMLENKTVVTVCGVLSTDDDKTEVLQKLLKHHIPDIHAFLQVLLHSEESLQKQAAKRSIQVLEAVLTKATVLERVASKRSRVVGWIFQFCGVQFSDDVQLDVSSCFRAMITTLDASTDRKVSSGDKFALVGMNATENLIRGFVKLDEANISLHGKILWSAIELQCTFIDWQMQVGNMKDIQLGFCVHVLTEAMLKPSLVELLPQILASMKKLLESALKYMDESTLKSEVTPVMQRLIGACLIAHEAFQQRLLKECQKKDRALKRLHFRSCGLLALCEKSSSSDAWGWEPGDTEDSRSAIENFCQDLDKEIYTGITKTYSVLEQIFEIANSLDLRSEHLWTAAIPCGLSSTDLAALGRVDRKFCAQKLARKFEEKQEEIGKRNYGMNALVKSLLCKLADRQAWNKAENSRENKPLQASAVESFGSMNVDQRLMYAELEQFEKELLGGGLESIANTDLESIVRELSFVCGSFCPKDIRVAAAKCLSEIDSQRLGTLCSEENSHSSGDLLKNVPVLGKDQLLLVMQSRCIESLGETLKASDASTALVAAETASALVSTKVGKACWSYIEKEGNAVLGPFVTAQSHDIRRGNTLLTSLEVNQLKAKLTSSEEESLWCWDEALWRCDKSLDFSFREWICTLTSAIILCCFRCTKDDSGPITEDAEFFWQCQRMSLLDAEFASRVFQSLVIRLLHTKSADYTRPLTASFTTLLSCGDSDSLHLNPHVTQALGLAIDTLHVLCQLSICQFSARKHKPNEAHRKTKPSSKNYNKKLSPTVPWRGSPYGVMLELDGLVVARACIRSQRYASGLFFLDLNFDSQFGSSGGILEDILESGNISNYKHDANISGNISMGRVISEGDQDSMKDSALAAMELKAKCLEKLDEKEALEALHIQMSALNFMEAGSVGAYQSFGNSGPLESLRQLNGQSHSRGQGPDLPVQMSQFIDELGCHRVTQSYIEGVLSQHSNLQSLSQNDLQTLNEKWYESSLKLRQWDCIDEIQLGIQPTLSQTSTQLTASMNDSMNNVSLLGIERSKVNRSPGVSSKEHGFFELLSRAIDSFEEEDTRSCCDFLAQGRLSLLSDLAHSGYGESPFVGIATRIDKLRAIRDVEKIASKMQSIEDIPRIWDMKDATSIKSVDSARQIKLFPTGDERGMSTKGVEIDLHDFSSAIREIVLRSLYKKHGSGSESFLFGILASHLGRLSVKAREGAREDVAEAALQRLHSILVLPAIANDALTKEYLQLQIRIEEAKLSEHRGDFSSAIRISKQVVDFLSRKHSAVENMDVETVSLLADAQICCGTWMAKHKVQQSKLVLDTYLRSGARLAQSVFESDHSLVNAERATRASLEFGQILSNLYDALKSRVTSLEWKQATAALTHQEREFEKANSLKAEAEANLKKLGRKHPKFPKCEKDYHYLVYFCSRQRKEIDATKTERERITSSKQEYLIQSIKSYLAALSIADTGIKADLSRHVFRLISLWFSNSGAYDGNESVNEIMRKGLESIPTFRFLPLVFQLVSRLESVEETEKELGKGKGEERAKIVEKERRNEFQSVLQRLLYRMAVDHPYHLLLPIIALSNGNKVLSNDYLENVGDRKVIAASKLLELLKKKGPAFISSLIDSYVTLTQSYIQLADTPTAELQKKKVTKGIRFSQVASPESKSSGRAALDFCLNGAECPPCIITRPPPVQPAGNYGDGMEDPIGAERIHSFESTFDITETGIHRPKIVVCLGTKGGRYRQLVKGEDDLRQDAVMTQVFRYVNELMMRRDHSSRRGSRSGQHVLQMVTYNVSPLSPRSGVLEWVEDTIPFGIYGEDQRISRSSKDVAAHSKFYPGEWGNSLCRQHLFESPPEQLRASFDEICKRNSPVFRFFFIERFGHNLQAWHAAKMKFTRSVAVTSIVGHILGIGDRHVKNILVHEKTGEVVHIDFGIVFEQGKLLTTPERVPFRLTRNVVDGMGPLGVEGTFTKSAEETMAVLRKNADALLTILSAVVDDPLYNWSLTPVEARKRQQSDEDANNNRQSRSDADNNGQSRSEGDTRTPDKNEPKESVPPKETASMVDSSKEENMAGARALAKIKAKLQGYEDSTSGELHGIEGQVQVLLSLARDPDNLCQMFPGWSPWI